jgi:hypothetical protein
MKKCVWWLSYYLGELFSFPFTSFELLFALKKRNTGEDTRREAESEERDTETDRGTGYTGERERAIEHNSQEVGRTFLTTRTISFYAEQPEGRHLA